MKTIKLTIAIFLIAISGAMAKKTMTSSTENTYFVQVSHTDGQCMKALNEMKGKGEAYLSKFYFGCEAGDHTGYAFLKGTSEEDVRKMLPKEEQANAKIEKVQQFTSVQLAKMHKDNTTKESK